MKKVSLSMAVLGAMLCLPLIGVQAATTSTTLDPALTIDERPVLGRTENVYYDTIPELKDVPFVGKIDTGADTTSMHAEQIHVTSLNPKYQHLEDDELLDAVVAEMNRLYENWNKERFKPFRLNVSFVIRHPYTGEKIQIKTEVARVSMIRSRSHKKPLLRPTITIPLTIAGRTVDTDVNLTDRSAFSTPFLIGKTFLEHNAWVFAGYDYLQDLPQAQIIGKHETVTIDGIPYRTSVSLKNRYSIAHARDIKVNRSQQTVSFLLEGHDGERKAMTLPLVKMLRVSGKSRPVVNLPVTLGNDQTMHWMVYLDDRHKLSSQLRLGVNTLSRYFMVNASQDTWLDKAQPTRLQSATKEQGTPPLMVSLQESIQVEGVQLPAQTSLTVQTPLLRVQRLIWLKGHKRVRFTLPDGQGGERIFTKPILRTIKVGKVIRPIVEGDLGFHGQTQTQEFALERVKGSTAEPYFVLGRKLAPEWMLINTRTENLLNPVPLFKAGHIEVAEVEGMRFPVKLDTGADISSLNAQDIDVFERQGKTMVSFTYENDIGMKKRFTREVVDKMRVRAREGEKTSVRLVVEMTVKLGQVEKTVEVNLKDRSRFHYSMILGKNFLKYGAMVSSDSDYIATPKPDFEP